MADDCLFPSPAPSAAVERTGSLVLPRAGAGNFCQRARLLPWLPGAVHAGRWRSDAAGLVVHGHVGGAMAAAAGTRAARRSYGGGLLVRSPCGRGRGRPRPKNQFQVSSFTAPTLHQTKHHLAAVDTSPI